MSNRRENLYQNCIKFRMACTACVPKNALLVLFLKNHEREDTF